MPESLATFGALSSDQLRELVLMALVFSGDVEGAKELVEGLPGDLSE